MAIGNAIQKGAFVYVYDEKGKQLFAKSSGNVSKGDGLKGYTSTTVNIQRGAFIYTYNDKGNQLSAKSAK
ncbi:MAG: hypothetical protein K2Q12_06095 [Rickettsiales bacterium]|nr:hypothetical protein [Rickettsiales bacterium]